MAGLVPLASDLAAALRRPAYERCYLVTARAHDCPGIAADARLARRAARRLDCARSARLRWQ